MVGWRTLEVQAWGLRSSGWRWLGAPGGPRKSKRGVAGQGRYSCNKRGRGLGEGEGRGPRVSLKWSSSSDSSDFRLCFFVFLNIYFWILPTGWTVSTLSLSLASLSLLLHSCRTLRPMEGGRKKLGVCLWRESSNGHTHSIIWRQCYMERNVQVRIMLENELVGVGWSSSSASLLF